MRDLTRSPEVDIGAIKVLFKALLRLFQGSNDLYVAYARPHALARGSNEAVTQRRTTN